MSGRLCSLAGNGVSCLFVCFTTADVGWHGAGVQNRSSSCEFCGVASSATRGDRRRLLLMGTRWLPLVEDVRFSAGLASALKNKIP